MQGQALLGFPDRWLTVLMAVMKVRASSPAFFWRSPNLFSYNTRQMPVIENNCYCYLIVAVPESMIHRLLKTESCVSWHCGLFWKETNISKSEKGGQGHSLLPRDIISGNKWPMSFPSWQEMPCPISHREVRTEVYHWLRDLRCFDSCCWSSHWHLLPNTGYMKSPWEKGLEKDELRTKFLYLPGTGPAQDKHFSVLFSI